ncbi:MAG: methyltransferase domain-containing protein [Marinibacterium sp.]
MDSQDPPVMAEQDPQAARIAQAEALLVIAEMQVFRNEPEAAFNTCKTALQSGELSLKQALQVSLILTRIHQNEPAAEIQKRLLAHVDQSVIDHPDDPEVLEQAGSINRALKREDKAAELLARAFALNPKNHQVGIGLSLIHLGKGDAEAAMALWTRTIDESDNPSTILLLLAQVFVRYDRPDIAEGLLARALPHCDDRHRINHDIIAAAMRGEDFPVDQHEKALEIFDAFSERYDTVLEGLGNNGPPMIARAVAETGCAPDRSLHVFDAGCGTGLCAPYLRPYAEILHGADISTQMLNVAKGKGGYDFLTRTDLSQPATFPEGPFDLVTCADTLVYFGALETVFDNFFDVIKPGGWLVFTVEEALETRPRLGYAITPSGRYTHHADFLTEQLTAAGFNPPAVMVRDTLRNEFARPVMGLAIAAQRLHR